MSAGKIWKEYWIDCAGPCGDHAPLGESAYAKAVKSAREKGWRNINGVWWCRRCKPTTEMAG